MADDDSDSEEKTISLEYNFLKTLTTDVNHLLKLQCHYLKTVIQDYVEQEDKRVCSDLMTFGLHYIKSKFDSETAKNFVIVDANRPLAWLAYNNTKIDFNKQYLVIPFVENKNHWYLFLCDGSKIVCYDSLGSSSNSMTPYVEKMLQIFTGKKFPVKMNFEKPIQKDGYSCGWFVMKFFSILLKQPGNDDIRFENDEWKESIKQTRETILDGFKFYSENK